PTNAPADVSGWFISETLGDPRKVLLPPGTVIPAAGYRVIPASVLATASFDGRMVIDSTSNTTLHLFAANRQARLTGYSDTLVIPVTEPGVSVGRILDSLGGEHVVAQAQTTLGAANSAARVGPLVISEVLYRPLAGPEYIELTNLSSEPLPLYDAATGEGWLLQGAPFRVPAGLTLPPGGRILLTALPAHEACVLFGSRGYTRILGPLQSPLDDAQQTLAVVKPVVIADAGTAYAATDLLTYFAGAPWPVQAATEGQALRRVNNSAIGDDPANWAPAAPPPGPGTPPAEAALCSFVVELAEGGMSVRWTLASAPGVTGFRIWRNTRPDRTGAVEVPVLLTAVSDAPEGADAPQAVAPAVPYTVIDAGAPAGAPLYYFLDAVTASGDLPLGFTAPLASASTVYLPVTAR
ncbi:MAG: lamin tail domain-containing protein, partial [Caldilineaceae bacterium]